MIERRFGSVWCGFHHDSIVVVFVFEHAAPGGGKLRVCDGAGRRVRHQDEGLRDEVVHPGPLLAVGTLSGKLISNDEGV